ncbi:DNA-binding protein [Haloarcula sp. 1CSR25-25]|uniref:PPC domain-containing DNA-binding protein n=1 Tax=Haloarcula sp. 1CSR25-25 TaxID=2862545 RepID=UPI002893FD4E|nr:DNA-binding protein [Haloarcula sp. 1CSR25-25]MDT3433985.1 DNA-binding protein [Haloarcula sp. 1CSR25-25]
MDYREVDSTSEFVCRLEHGADWREEIETFADRRSIDAGFFYGLGAVQNAELMFYDQDRTEYDSLTFDEPLEVAACMGNISHLDGERFAHTHAVLSRPDGEAVAGHLNAGTVWAGELYVRGFDTTLRREHDEPTDLDLWNI